MQVTMSAVSSHTMAPLDMRAQPTTAGKLSAILCVAASQMPPHLHKHYTVVCHGKAWIGGWMDEWKW